MKNTYHKIATEISTSHTFVLDTLPTLAEIAPSARVTIAAAQLSELGDTGFTVTGIVKAQGNQYDFTVFYTPEGVSFKAHLLKDGAILLTDAYPPASVARIADNFYNQPIDMYEDVIISDVIITGDEVNAEIEMTITFGSECFLVKRYYHLMPDSGVPVKFSGSIKNGQYTITGRYIKNNVSLPLLSVIPVNEAWLTITSHTFDYYDFSKNDGIMNLVEWTGSIPLEIGEMKNIRLKYRLYDHGQRFHIASEFGEKGLSINDMYALITQLSGREETYPLPEWFILKDLSLRSVLFILQKDIAQETVWQGFEASKFIGVGVDIALKLPDIPIPFFEFDDGGGATVSLYTQWDMMDIGGSLSMAARFESHWRGYALNLQLLIPDLYFEGRLKLEDPNDLNNKPFSIFPGFTNLVVDEIYVAGSIPEIAYSLLFRLVNKNSITVNEQIQIGNKAFTINNLEAHAFYNPEGLGMGLDLYFDMYGASFYVAGTYEYDKAGSASLLTLKGRLVNKISLVQLLNDIFGTDFDSDSDSDLTITQLGLLYAIELGKDNFSSSNVKEFRFEGGLKFDWKSVGPSLETLADIHYANEDWNLYFKTVFTWSKFYLSASCKLSDVQSENMQFEEAVFIVRFMDMSLEATVKNKIISVELKNINLGLLLEELVNTLIPGTQWYIPWPFKILKQITLNNITLELGEDDAGKYTFRARYAIDLKILFFTVETLELAYDGSKEADENFLITLNISGAFTNNQTLGTSSDEQKFEILNGRYDLLPGLAKIVIDFRYLAIGQHIEVDIPSKFDVNSVKTLIDNIKAAIKENSSPKVDEKNNWVAALQITILQSIHVDLLLCDPGFYGVKFEITGGSPITDQLKGLMFCILYGKVSERVGVFKAYLTLPEIFKTIQLEFVDIYLGDIGLAIYTDGHFYIDCGFPHKGDFKKAFGINVIAIIGKGGFYIGFLDGDASDRVPVVSRGHFDVVLELGIGVALGVGKSINTGILSAEAYIQIEAMFEGVFAIYIDTADEESAYYKIAAMIGIAAVAKAELDAKVFKISVSVSATAKIPITVERYRKCQVMIVLELKIKAFAKILFIKINFSFTWNLDLSFEIGNNSIAPWENSYRLLSAEAIADIVFRWNEEKLFDEIKTVKAFILPYFSVDNQSEPQHRTAFTALLTGYQNDTLEYLCSANTAESSISVLIEAFLTRALKAAGKEKFSQADIHALVVALSDPKTYDTGFSMAQLNSFFENNIHLILLKGTMDETIADSTDIHAVPLVLPPLLKLFWQTPGTDKKSFDLSKDPNVTDKFFDNIEEYYNDLRVENKPHITGMDKPGESAATAFFRDYFYTLTKLAVSQAENSFPKGGQLSIEEIVQLVLPQDDYTIIDEISGSLSRTVFGGIRVPVAGLTTSMFTFACQQYQSIVPSENEIHNFEMQIIPGQNWLELQNVVLATSVSNRKLLLDMGTPSESLIWSLTKSDMEYPQDTFDFPYKAKLCEYYSKEIRTISLKPPVQVIESSNAYYESSEIINANYYIAGHSQTTTSSLLSSGNIPFERGEMVYLTVSKVTENIFSLCSLGYNTIESLYRIKDTIASAEIYREANPIDAKGTGLLPIGGAFIYRSNLSLETEKPKVRSAVADTFNTIRNSADFETEPDIFTALLRDAALVNSKGYFIRCTLPDHALEDGQTKLVLWLGHDENATWAKLEKQQEVNPVVVTDESSYMQKYDPGVFEFAIAAEEPKTDILQLFQMLSFYVVQSDYFRKSNESMPLIADENWVYSQVVYGHKFALGSLDNPYNGIKENSIVTLNFFLLDLLGNRTQECSSFSFKYGYTDPVLSPSAYPQTKVTYVISGQTESTLIFDISFTFNSDDENKDDIKKASRLAYYQLLQSDMTVSATLLGNEYTLDKNPLLQYLKALYTTGVSTSAVYRCETSKPGDFCTEIIVEFSLTRNKACIAEQLVDTPFEDVAGISVPLVMGEQNETFIDEITKDSERGKFYYIQKIKPAVVDSGVSFWSLPPLSTKLVSMSDLELLDASGKTVKASFVNIDLEEWADIILKDFEDYIAPGSKYTNEKNTILEEMLGIKQELAGNIAGFAVNILRNNFDAAHRQKAVDCYNNYLLRNLYTGRRINAVSVMDTGIDMPHGYNLLGYIKQKNNKGSDVSVSGQKITKDKLLAFVVNAEDISAKKDVAINFQYILSDWEKENSERPSYYTLLKTVTIDINQVIPLVYKRYPSDPALPLHFYSQNKSSQWYEWNYTMELAHECAAQDIILMKVLLTKPVTLYKKASEKTLAEAFAQYIYLRNEMLSGQVSDALFVQIFRDIASLWKSGVALFGSASNSESVSFYINDNVLHLAIINKDFHVPSIKICASDGNWHDLQHKDKNESKPYYQYEYMLPDMDFPRPYRLKFVFSGFDIRKHRYVESQISISRNQNIESINTDYIYRTQWFKYYEDLLPVISYPNILAHGAFVLDNFVTTIEEYVKDFDSFSIECSCARLMTATEKNGNVYSYLPVLFVPSVESQNHNLPDVYNAVKVWIEHNISLEKEKNVLVECYISMSSSRRLVAEVASVRFKFN